MQRARKQKRPSSTVQATPKQKQESSPASDHSQELSDVLQKPDEIQNASPALVNRLQRTIGNFQMTKLLQNADRKRTPKRPVQRQNNPTAQKQQPQIGAEGGEIDTDTEREIEAQRGKGDPLPDDVRGQMENAFNADFGTVRVHTGPTSNRLNRRLSSNAFTSGSNIFFRGNTTNSRSNVGLLAHELTHVVQQGSAQRKTIQRNYVGLSDMAKSRVDSQAQAIYYQKAEEFEYGMAKKIEKGDDANAIVNKLLARIKQIVDAWADSTGREKKESYAREFGWRGGDDYYGAFLMTGDNIKDVFDHADAKPMRTKLKIVYNAVRNNNLAKWLKIAANELDTIAKGKRAKAQKIRTATGSVYKYDKNGNKIGFRDDIKTATEKKDVQAGFAEQSGLKDWLSKEQVKSLKKTSDKERKTYKRRSHRDIYGHDKYSASMNWHGDTVKANSERRGGQTKGMDKGEDSVRTLDVGDVDDLTKEEVQQLRKNKGEDTTSTQDYNDFRSNPDRKIEWGQGGEWYDIIPDSDSAKAARNVGARLEAGISGSTDLMMHAIQYLGISDMSEKKAMRLALAGWMMANRDHSFYEIYKAAESYGVPFTVDADRPGYMYEAPENITPMQRNDFKSILNNKFPSWYMTTDHKDDLADNLPDANRDQASFRAELSEYGIDPESQKGHDKKMTALLVDLRKAVTTAEFPNANASYREKNQVLRRLKAHNSYQEIASTKTEKEADALLMSMVRAVHGGKGALPETTYVDALADAGMPRKIAGMLSPQAAKSAWDLVGAIKKLTKDGDGKLQLGGFVGQFNSVFGNNRHAWAGMMNVARNFHGDSALGEEQMLLANAARMMSGHQNRGAQKMTTDELDNLDLPDITGLTADLYWNIDAAKDKLKSNIGEMTKKYTGAIKKGDETYNRVYALLLQQMKDNPHNRDVPEDDLKAILDDIAPTDLPTYLPADMQIEMLWDPEQREAHKATTKLHDKELGAIFQYTGDHFKTMVGASNRLGTDDVNLSQAKNTDWQSKGASLKFSGPRLDALASGLAKLPVYSGTTVSVFQSGKSWDSLSDKRRRRAALKEFPIGKIITKNFPMSAGKSMNSAYIKSHVDNPGYDHILEITDIKSGHDIQLISDKFKEEEVLFAPGSRFEVYEVLPYNPNKPTQKVAWIRMREV